MVCDLAEVCFRNQRKLYSFFLLRCHVVSLSMIRKPFASFDSDNVPAVLCGPCAQAEDRIEIAPELRAQNLCGRTLRACDEMDTSSASDLTDPLKERKDFCLLCRQQISEFVDDDKHVCSAVALDTL